MVATFSIHNAAVAGGGCQQIRENCLHNHQDAEMVLESGPTANVTIFDQTALRGPVAPGQSHQRGPHTPP